MDAKRGIVQRLRAVNMDRRQFLIRAAELSLAVSPPGLVVGRALTRRPECAAGFKHGPTDSKQRAEYGADPRTAPDPATIFLSGDVMTGRGIDQVLPHPGDPSLFEPYVQSATTYVDLAEERNGPIPKPADYSYIWGDALAELERVAPAVRIINLETSVTTSDDRWRGKRIHYRMHPTNVACLSAAGIDCCVLANNHVLDWGTAGLAETLEVLERAGIRTAGAGLDLRAALAPAVLQLEAGRRLLVFGFGAASSGIPGKWAAGGNRSGLNFLPDLSPRSVQRIAGSVHRVKRGGDLVVASIHWGSNWGYEVPRPHREFAHRLIDEAGVDVIHGHSSHHPRGIEVYKDRPILYGCGDLLNDYEGISGYERFRSDLVLLYFVSFDPADGRLVRLQMSPLQIRRFRLNRASKGDAEWLRGTLTRESRAFGSRVEPGPDVTLILRWN